MQGDVMQRTLKRNPMAAVQMLLDKGKSHEYAIGLVWKAKRLTVEGWTGETWGNGSIDNLPAHQVEAWLRALRTLEAGPKFNTEMTTPPQTLKMMGKHGLINRSKVRCDELLTGFQWLNEITDRGLEFIEDNSNQGELF